MFGSISSPAAMSMAAIQTPCTKVCTLDPASGLCLGCGRTGGEIASWAAYSESERARIMALLPDRLARSRASAGAANG